MPMAGATRDSPGMSEPRAGEETTTPSRSTVPMGSLAESSCVTGEPRAAVASSAGFAAAEILAQASSDDLEAFRAVIPSGTTPKPVEISEDGSAAVFELYAGTEWEATNGAPIGRVIVRR
jgi:hypothetical protein